MEVGVNTGVQVCTRKKMKIAGFSKKKKAWNVFPGGASTSQQGLRRVQERSWTRERD